MLYKVEGRTAQSRAFALVLFDSLFIISPNKSNPLYFYLFK